MTNPSPTRSIHRPGERILDCEIQRVVPLPHIHATYYELVHAPTGARLIHIDRDDTENTFGVAFKTVPTDSTGVAHILEHTVLCGSAKYPVRDPFFSMIKRSLNTFMNAFTASDWTLYPFSTQNEKDFYNLMDVYLDAVFFPKLDRLSFKQEGHRLEKEGDGLSFKGVVYNEMKGAMSSPDQILYRAIMQSLCPDTTYRNNSGGEPSDIPTLTHEQLLAFHARHYHPSNGFFYTYGNLPLSRHIAFVHDKILSRFTRIDPKTDIPSQPRWRTPGTAARSYPLDLSEKPDKKYQFCMAWLTADILHTFDVLGLTLLSDILLGNPASPLRKTLIESGLGSALSDGTGFDADHRDTVFACGLKDVTRDAGPKIESMIFGVLDSLAKTGIDSSLIEAAIHQVEFHRKEITNTPYPYGLKLFVSMCGTWIHGGDPLRVLDFDADLDKIKAAVAQGGFFESMIQTQFLGNPHRIAFTLIPDHEVAAREDAKTAADLARIMKDLKSEDLTQIDQDAAALTARQEAREDISVLPTLTLADIPKTVRVVAPSPPVAELPGIAPLTWYDQPTSGILYATCAVRLSDLPAPLIPLVPFFCYAMPKIGTRRHDYVDVARRIDRYTGGIGFSQNSRTAHEPQGQCIPYISFGGKCLERNVGPLFDLLDELLSDVVFDNLPRLQNLLSEYRAAMESTVVHNGHRFAMSLASRTFSVARHLSEQWQGIHQLKMIKQLAADPPQEPIEHLAGRLNAMARTLFVRGNLKMALIGETPALQAAVSPVSAMIGRMPPGEKGPFAPPAQVSPPPGIPREGWSTATAVSFVAQCFETAPMGHADAPVLSVIAKMLKSLFIHREIREKGGAYGGFASYNPEDGVFAFGSYRDPHIVNTLSVFESARAFIRSGDYDAEDVKEAILQVCSEIDRPDPPGPAARSAFYRMIVGLSDPDRLAFKTRLLAVTRQDVMRVAESRFAPDASAQGIAVVSNPEKLRAANVALASNPLALHAI